MAKKKTQYRVLTAKELKFRMTDIRVELQDPQLVAGGTGIGSLALQFKLALVKVPPMGVAGAAEPLQTSIGWRVMKGKIYPPARRLGPKGAFIPIVKMSQQLEDALITQLKDWWEAVPEIRFPGQPPVLEVDRSEDEKTVDSAPEVG